MTHEVARLFVQKEFTSNYNSPLINYWENEDKFWPVHAVTARIIHLGVQAIAVSLRNRTEGRRGRQDACV